MTAYLDLTLGVKSTFFDEKSVVPPFIGSLGVAGLSDADAFRVEGRRIDFRPAKVGNFEPNFPLLVVAGGLLVGCGASSTVDGRGIGGKGLIRAALCN